MKIFKLLLVLIITITAILIGTPIKYNCLYLNVAIILIGMIWIVYQHFGKKEKIYTNKIDIIAFILCVCPIIPIIANTYISFDDTIIYFLKYISCFVIYLLTKHLVQKEDKNIDWIINTIILCSTILCIIGIDNMTTKFFTQGLEALNLPYVLNPEARMFSSLGYANSFAIILAVSIILILDRMVNHKSEKYQTLYAGSMFLNVACLVLTYSRAVMLFLALAIVIYLFVKYHKNKFITVFYTLMINGILSIFYVMIWNNLISKEVYLIIWLVTLIITIVSILFQKIFDILYSKIETIPTKFYVGTIVAIMIVAVLALWIGTKLVVPLTIFEPQTSNETVKHKISNIESNTDYSFKFDINAKSTWEDSDNYKIVIEEENKYYDKVASHEITFNNCDEIQELNFKTSEETIEVAILFESQNKTAQLGLTVKSLTINDKEYPLKYRYLPKTLVDKVQSINLNSKSVWERGTFYIDSIKIIKNHFLFGLGGNAWKYSCIDVKSYNYASTEAHSYILQTLMDYGIVALIVLISLIIVVLIQMIKNKKTNYLGIGIALALLIAHSCIDFNMSFFFIMLIAFTLLGIVSSKKEEANMTNEKKDIIIMLIMMVVLLSSAGLGIGQIMGSSKLESFQQAMVNTLKRQKYDYAVELIKDYRKTERYGIYNYELSQLDYSSVSDENLNYIYEMIEKVPITVNIQYNMQKNDIIVSVLNSCKNQEIKNKFARLAIDQNEEMVAMINNKEKNRLMPDEINYYLQQQEYFYDIVNNAIQ
ncbi:MAG: O-antigen ligase family protein [Clostridia bacterium]|nr:O-antigen ligase family protein [Clostridia bacterium]